MRLIALCTVVLLFTSAVLVGAWWSDCVGRGLIPFWVNAGDFYTFLVFVNEDDCTHDVLLIRFCDDHGNWCSDTTRDMYSIHSREMLVFSTRPKTPHWIPTTGNYGHIKFRTEEGSGHICAWVLIYNDLSGASMVVPAYDQHSGF